MNTTARLVVLLVAQAAEIHRLHRHISVIGVEHRADIARLRSESDDGWSPDAEDCGACDEDLCRYHHGVEIGVDHLLTAIRAIGEDPDLMNHVLRGTT
ncbi:MAG: hypothetical protein M3548_17895 [Actinomycetota bacterium]|nr:hypothetical protein [Actinomycetota bacterium]